MRNFTKTELLILNELVARQIDSNITFFETIRNPNNEHKKFYINKQKELKQIQSKLII